MGHLEWDKTVSRANSGDRGRSPSHPKEVKAHLPKTSVRLPRKVLLSDPRSHSLNYRRGDRLFLTSSCEGPSARAFSEHFSGRAFCVLLFALLAVLRQLGELLRARRWLCPVELSTYFVN